MQIASKTGQDQTRLVAKLCTLTEDRTGNPLFRTAIILQHQIHMKQWDTSVCTWSLHTNSTLTIKGLGRVIYQLKWVHRNSSQVNFIKFARYSSPWYELPNHDRLQMYIEDGVSNLLGAAGRNNRKSWLSGTGNHLISQLTKRSTKCRPP